MEGVSHGFREQFLCTKKGSLWALLVLGADLQRKTKKWHSLEQTL
jgi:hypothetical protein